MMDKAANFVVKKKRVAIQFEMMCSMKVLTQREQRERREAVLISDHGSIFFQY